ncbi:acyl-CoA dehydrogenase family protein [Oceanicola sp. 502str15]|uniref:acyl-CoA dehydrogenase family protein n=1 Tax=Oceanicola sp. 502str15 TaxID=2696061 RepID=UPI0020964B68|nr:acyl-CoA dehydrogenase family protein [Oceanicola sp. 502str15]MCO6381556.1 acyl-CoA dehydrogenase [Oceanicola sp. 502str15]
MNFEMTDDRRMLADSLSKLLGDRYGIEHRNAVAYEAPFHDKTGWNALAELGILYAFAPEDAGGMGGSGFDLLAVFEQLGAALCPEPLLGAVMAAPLLTEAKEDLEPLLSGEAIYALAVDEPEAPWDAGGGTCEGGDTLTGRKTAIYGANAATHFLVSARREGKLALYEVKAEDAAVTPWGMIDGGGAGELMLDGTPARCLIPDAGEAIDAALDRGRLALCAEAVGAMDWCYATTLDYLKSRKQFGREIGSFQALQHRMVEMKTAIEQARSITILAADRMDAHTTAMAKSLVGRTARKVSEEAIQLHGGIGMTWEYPLSHYAKRLVMLDAQLGDADFHTARVAASYA